MELALDTGQIATAESWEAKLRDFQGESALLADYYKARRLAQNARSGSDPSLADAQQLQKELAAARADWPPVQVLQSLILERKGQAHEAVQAMQQAIALGDRSPATYGRLITLLFETGREDEAAEYLSEVRKLGVANSEQSSMLEMLVASGLGNLDQAIQAGAGELS